jgi:hypothetical protein
MKKLTGRTRFRAAEVVQTGLVPAPALVWQVETVRNELSLSGQMVTVVYDWRDGQVEDLCEINHIVYSTINVTVELPTYDTLPGEKTNARKLH